MLDLAAGGRSDYGEGFDIYSVGAVVFEMLTGLKPFGDAEELEGDIVALEMSS